MLIRVRDFVLLVLLDLVTPFTRMNSRDGVVGSYEAE